MVRRALKRSALALVLSLSLAALPALAQGRPQPASPASHGAVQSADWLQLTWSFLTGLWSGAPSHSLTSARGAEGGSLDPDGKPKVIIPSPGGNPAADAGGSLDPDGHH